MRSESTFSYSTQPQPAPIKRKNKYRESSDVQNERAGNLMYDSRVARGNTYSARLTSTSFKSESPGINRKLNRGSSERNVGESIKRSSTPPAVAGRMHMNMQTENFLEELTDKRIEIDAETQTQAFLDRPASPLFVMARTGVDAVTQILSNDLFDFDTEVVPILEVLVGKTLHVAMLELMQEEELEVPQSNFSACMTCLSQAFVCLSISSILQAIYRQQEEFTFLRSIELAEVQRLEAESKRKAKEKTRRIDQELIRVATKRALEEKIAAQYFSQQYLGSIHTNVFDLLQGEGHFYDPLQREIEEVTMVDLLASLRLRSDFYEAARQIADELLAAAKLRAREFENRAIIYREEKEEEKRLQELRDVAEKQMEAERIAKEKAKKDAAEGEDSEHDDW